MSVRQVWKRKTPLPKSSPTCHNDTPPPPPRNTPHSISPPMDYPQRDRIINQLHTISTLIDSQTPTPPSSPHPLVQPPTNAQVGCHASFCHCCSVTNVCVGLLSGLKAILTLRSQPFEMEILNAVQGIFQSVLVEGGICESQRRASSDRLGLLARLGNDMFTCADFPSSMLCSAYGYIAIAIDLSLM
ncbi:hypothetical protein Tco_1477111 [Tanacetum coccineum]